ncbi:LptF/LptG family permease [uncultured Aquimarina sp.]|uniref:LptF/LptG family permease n=1 Tax=uncultured Aquimarina sp. TaxID=575652 RepID=UPI00260C0335|nr:LptF/LptG family permease [uncultured Aquimarina sp.]
MKILDRYILTTFLKTFFPLFIIIMFILLLQTIWLFISELAGKDLDFSVIIKFLTYATPRLIPMVLPLTILLTSIMIFGNFAENYEFAAMKSSGISLQRAMRTLSVFIFFVGIGAFLFSNTVIPNSERKFVNLRKNIVKVKPAMVITPNQFNDLGDINIRVSEKYGDNDQFIKDVIIHKKGVRAGNFTVIKATDGELKGSIDSDLITLVLNDGNYYDEIQQKSPKQRKKLPFAKTYFKQYVLNMDLSSLDNVDMDAQQYSKGYNMLNVSGLKNEIDTLSIQVNDEVVSTQEDVNRRNGFKELNRNLKIDTLKKATVDTLDLINDRFNVRQKSQIYNLAFSNVDGVIRRIQTSKRTLEVKKRALNKYEMSLHDKYALGIACVLLFFVGAPLGAIIRKGGLGLPIVIGVVLFLTYHFIGIFAKNGAEEGGVPPFVGSWLSTFIIFPLSIFLTYRATRDRGFVSFDILIQPIRDFFEKKFSKSKENKVENSLVDEEIDVVIDENILLQAEKDKSDFQENSILVISLFILLVLVNTAITLISKGTGDSKIMLLLFNCLGIIAYLVFYFKSYVSHRSFYAHFKGIINKPSLLLFFILGIPLYPFVYFYYKNKMNKDLNKIR